MHLSERESEKGKAKKAGTSNRNGTSGPHQDQLGALYRALADGLPLAKHWSSGSGRKGFPSACYCRGDPKKA